MKTKKPLKKTKKRMPPKNQNIEDVKSPEKVAPNTSARPIVVTNRPVLANDPMMVAETKPEDTAVVSQPEVVNRTAKTIAPMDATLEAPAATVEVAISPVTQPQPETPTGMTSEPALQPETPVAAPEVAPSRELSEQDAELAATTAAESEASAQEARQQELEKLIASGQYVVPINAVSRKRSHVYALVFCIVAVVLALAALDVILDADLVKLPWQIPHTDFF